MRISNADAGPKMNLVITDHERAIAKQIKDDFKKIIDDLEDSVEVVQDLRDAIVEQRPSKEDLKTKYSGRLLRYRRKIRKIFNEFLIGIKDSFEKLSEISDPDMIKLREILIAEIDELSDGAESLMDTLKEVDREGFTKTVEQLVAQIEKRQKSIIDVIENQLYSHIDHDILGRLKISDMQFRIRRRARIIKQIIRGK